MNKSYEDLRVWNRAIDLVEQIYVLTKSFPKDELYGLTNQARRSAVSIPSNIAEGCSRNSDREFYQFLGIASGSLAELKTQIIIANKVEYLTEKGLSEIKNLIDEVARMLNALKKTVNASSQQPEASNTKLIKKVENI